MAEVFLSYAREDTGRARALAAALERAGRSVWWDRNIEGGSEYSVEIDDALKAAEAVVVLWSVHSVGSAWVRDEAAAGRDSQRLVPVQLDSAEPPLGFRQFQTIDLSRWKGRDGPGLKTLKSAVAAKLARPSALASATPPVPGDVPASLPGARHLPMVALVIGLLLAAAAAAYFLLGRPQGGDVPTIAIVRAPSGGDAAKSDALARAMSVELGAFQAGSADNFELRDAAGGTPDVDYLVEVAASEGRGTANADLSLLSRAGRQILWTSHLEKPASAPGHLRLPAATRLLSVLSCLAEATGSGEKLDQSVLKLYLRGCEKFRDEIGGILDPAQLATLREVVDRAPRFAPAIAHLALLEMHDNRPAAARALIARAKKLNPKLAKIYLAEADLYPRSQWSRRHAIISEGLKRDPNSAALHASMAFELGQVGRRTLALESMQRARELDPISPVIRADQIHHLMNSGNSEAALKELQASESIWPNSTTLTDIRFAYDMRFGDPKQALRSLRENASTATTLGSTVGVRNPGPELFLVARIDPTPQNIDAVEKAYVDRLRNDPGDVGSMTVSLGFFGRLDPIFKAMAHPVAIQKSANHTNNFFRPFMKPVLHDPRFMALAARLGLARYWTETGKWPDFCLDSDLPYDCKTEAARLKRAGQVR